MVAFKSDLDPETQRTALAPKNIAIIEPVGGHGGMDYYDYGLLSGLVGAGLDAKLYTCDETKPLLGLESRTVLAFQKVYGSRSKVRRAVSYLRGLAAAIVDARRTGGRICHLHFFHYTLIDFMGVFLARLCGMRVVSTIHDVESFARGGGSIFAKLVFRMSNALIVHNRSSHASLAGAVADGSKISIVPHGNYLPYVQDVPATEQARMKLGLPVYARVVLFFGQIKEVKGLDVLLEAWARALPRLPSHARLVIAGKPWKDSWTRYESQIVALGIGDTVTLDIRFIEDEKAKLYYSSADLVVLPYRKIYQSGVLLMAMSYGKAVLASDIPGMTDIVRDGENGLLFRTEDPVDLADRLVSAMSNPDGLNAIGASGERWVDTNCDWKDIGRRTAEVYEKI